MNIKITKKQFKTLTAKTNSILATIDFGSYLYETNTETSDRDIMIIIDNIFEVQNMFPITHCFQYDDVENNIQYLITTHRTFNYNLFSGESNINAEIVLFSNDNFVCMYNEKEKLSLLRTYNIIKGFIGRSKFDLKLLGTSKDKKGHKAFHISRCLYIAECLLNNELPKLEEISKYKHLSKQELSSIEVRLRTMCNSLYEKDCLTLYPSTKNQTVEDLFFYNGFSDNDVMLGLEKLLFDSISKKEFTY